MRRAAAVRPDVPAQVAAVDSRVDPESDADPAPVESSVGLAFRRSVYLDSVSRVGFLVCQADCRVFLLRACPLAAAPASLVLEPPSEPANLEFPRWHTARSRSQSAKN
jgi:hypothetical protein